MVQITPAWIAAPILAQRNIELAEISVTFDSLDSTSVFTMRATDGTIGVFSVPAIDLAAAGSIEAIRAIIEPLFQTVEFTSGKPVVPEVQQPDAGPVSPDAPAETGIEDGPGITEPVNEGSPVAEDVTEGQGQEPGQNPVQTDE